MKERTPLSAGFRKAFFSRKSLYLLFEVGASILGLMALVFCLLLGRLSMGPINLDFIIPDVEEAFNIEIDNESMEQMMNVHSAVEIIEKKLTKSTA